MEPEPITLTSLVIPNALNNTFSCQLFLINEYRSWDDKTLIPIYNKS